MELQDLSKALASLAQRILEVDEEEPLVLARLLMLDVDRDNFEVLFERFGTRTFHALRQALESYYLRQKGERIRWQSEVLRGYCEQFIEVGVFVLDLGLSGRKEQYIESILELGQEAQQALQPLVEQVTRREEFVEPRGEAGAEDRTRQHLLELAEENQKLRAEREHLHRKYQELRESYDYLKGNHDKTAEELNLLRQEKYTFINQLGGSECGTVDETIERIKRELEAYQKTVERLGRETEEKKTALKVKDDEIRQIERNFKEKRFEEQNAEVQELRRRLRDAQREVAASRGREEELRTQLQGNREYLKGKQEEVMRLQRTVASLQSYGAKYQTIRKLHNHFKSKIVKEIKEVRQ